ncbi:hypothetical protein NLG97_g3098 [Lecanicillium saksenae]|uniref:Uncharacterized protein n=1 Tax=Lecanicillium saksenae TaxID=468837 RepID=A0ACC1QZ04_9HYPO|nr:hypothetical protein NLG97_g3098 [Lecanicillium saksenae]
MRLALESVAIAYKRHFLFQLPLLSAWTASQQVTSLSLLLLVVMARLANSDAAEGRPKAFVYYGPHDSFKLSQSVGELLESSPHKFEVEYVSPENITADLLATGKIFAYPGGYDVQESWDALESVAPVIRDYVANGGRYIGFCLGAYMASDSPGLGFLPREAEVDAECDQKGAQVPDDRDTVIQVDWRFSSGPNAGKTVKDRWIYYQEGNLVKDFPENSTSFVIARYSTTGNIAATLNKYGDGWVGTTGPHPEANQSWFDEYNITAPDGLQYEIGWDLIEATMSGGQGVTTLSSSGNQSTSNAPSKSDGASTATFTAPAKSAGSRRRSNPLRRLFGR